MGLNRSKMGLNTVPTKWVSRPILLVLRPILGMLRPKNKCLNTSSSYTKGRSTIVIFLGEMKKIQLNVGVLHTPLNSLMCDAAVSSTQQHDDHVDPQRKKYIPQHTHHTHSTHFLSSFGGDCFWRRVWRMHSGNGCPFQGKQQTPILP